MSTVPNKSMTPEEYLEFERAATDCKHEYYQGEIFAMSGGTWEHGILIAAVIGELHAGIKNKSCYVASSDLRVKVDAYGLYTYPDASVVCDEPEFDDNQKDTLTNPLMIVEVLSESTERYDRGKKFEFYRTIPSLQHYVLISQAEPHVEVFTRSAETSWLLTEATGMDASVELSVLEVTLSLSELYRQIEFEKEEPRRPGDAR